MSRDSIAYLLVEFEIPVRGVSKFNQAGHLHEAIRKKKELKYFSEPEEYLMRNNFVHESASDSCVPGILIHDYWKVMFVPLIDTDDEHKRTAFLKCLSNYNPSIYKNFSGGFPSQIPFAKIDCLLSVDRHGYVAKFNPDIKKWVSTSDGSDEKFYSSGLKTVGDSILPNTSHRLIFFSTDFNSYSFRVCQEKDKILPGLKKKEIRSYINSLTIRMSDITHQSSIELAMESQASLKEQVIKISPTSSSESSPSLNLFAPISTSKQVDSNTPINSRPVDLNERKKRIWFKKFLPIVEHTAVIKNHRFEICESYAYEVCGLRLNPSSSNEIIIQQERLSFQANRFPVIASAVPKIERKCGSVYLFRCGTMNQSFEAKISQKFINVQRIVLLRFSETEDKNKLFSPEEDPVDPSSFYENANDTSIILKKFFNGPSPRSLERSLAQLGSLIKLPQVKTSGKLHNKEDPNELIDSTGNLLSRRNSLISISDMVLGDQPGKIPPPQEEQDESYLMVPRSPSPSSRSVHSVNKKIVRDRTISQVLNRISNNGQTLLMGKTLDQLAGERTTHRSDWLLIYGETNWLNFVSMALRQVEEICQLIKDEQLLLRDIVKKTSAESKNVFQGPNLMSRRIGNYEVPPPIQPRTTSLAPEPVDDSIFLLCGPGSGRTWQCVISSLIQVCTDEKCRQLEGFEDLIEREWVRAGYAFSPEPIRPNSYQRADINKDFDNCASFVLFLDCVHQLVLQYPTEFEFTQDYLVILLDSAQSKGGGLPPFSVEFSSSCEASRVCSEEKISTEIQKFATLAYFNTWEDRLTYEGLRLLPNWLYWWKYHSGIFKHSGNASKDLPPTLFSKNDFLSPCYEPLTMLQPWMHAFFRWTRPARIVNGGYANIARAIRLNLLPTFQSAAENPQWHFMTSSSPYSGWFSDEAMNNCIEGMDGPPGDHFLNFYSKSIYSKPVENIIYRWKENINEES